DAGRADPVLSAMTPQFWALESHYYGHGLPEGAVALSENAACLQGFRLGDACWGIQFHPEVTEAQLDRWIEQKEATFEPRQRIGEWNELGRKLCNAFLNAARAA